MSSFLNIVWTEKHRPNAVEFVVGNVKNDILKMLEHESSMPHLLFHSTKPGTGKSSLAMAIAAELGTETLMLNTSDDRKIEVVREKIKEFARTKSLSGKRKVIIMDEIDGMLKASQEALRGIMEQYASSALFILTCNNITAIHEAVIDRCVKFDFSYPDKKEIEILLRKICEVEKVSYTDGGLTKLIDLHYPSIRSMVKTLQKMKMISLDVTESNVTHSDVMFDTLIDFINNKDYVSVRDYIWKYNLDAREFNLYLWYKFVTENNVKGIQLCGRNERDCAIGADPKVIVVTSLIELVK